MPRIKFRRTQIVHKPQYMLVGETRGAVVQRNKRCQRFCAHDLCEAGAICQPPCSSASRWKLRHHRFQDNHPNRAGFVPGFSRIGPRSVPVGQNGPLPRLDHLPAKSIDSRSLTTNHSLLSCKTIGCRSRIKPHNGFEVTVIGEHRLLVKRVQHITRPSGRSVPWRMSSVSCVMFFHFLCSAMRFRVAALSSGFILSTSLSTIWLV